jgi:predicted nucleic-acid-binding protein
MKKVLIDLNIILDFLNKHDDHLSALSVFDLCIRGKLKGYVSSHEITTLSYFLEKQGHKRRKRNLVINQLLDNLSVLTAHEKILRDALLSGIDDYEDAVIDELAENAKVDCIVSKNLKDFKKGKNKVLTAREVLALFT